MVVSMTQTEALRLALEALKQIDEAMPFPVAKLAQKVIKEALAQPEPNYKKALEVWLDKTEWVQETVKPHELGMHRADVLKQRIENASPQRTWVGLTDEEINLIYAEPQTHIGQYARAIEAKLKEKNT
jgi:hypothetical protein